MCGGDEDSLVLCTIDAGGHATFISHLERECIGIVERKEVIGKKYRGDRKVDVIAKRKERQTCCNTMGAV